MDGAGDVHFGLELFPEPAFGQRDLLAVAEGAGFLPCYPDNFFAYFQQAFLAISGGVIYENRFRFLSLNQRAELGNGLVYGNTGSFRVAVCSSARMIRTPHHVTPQRYWNGLAVLGSDDRQMQLGTTSSRTTCTEERIMHRGNRRRDTARNMYEL